MLKKIGLGLLGLTAAGSIYQRYTQSMIFTRNLRTVRCGLHILIGYKLLFNEDNFLDIHQSVAQDIYQTCHDNDGLYVKFGQGIATMDHMLPPPFYKHMTKLNDQAKQVSFKKIKAVFQEDTGMKIQDIFSQFDQNAVASASIAQVHKARLKDGQQVAVKIQKPNIRKQFASDMFMHYLINWVIEYSFDLPLLHFVEDIQKNLQKELNFVIQAENSKIGRHNFQKMKRSQFYVPRVIDNLTRQRVLVTQWIDGFKITQKQKMDENNFNKRNLVNDLIRAFAQQIFVTGFIHFDPHPGNVLVRPHPQNPKKHQIVIIDFGLCFGISQDFRLTYANFWKNLFLNNGMDQTCRKWGIKNSETFAGMTLMRPYSKHKLLTKKIQKDDVMRMQKQMKDRVRQLMKDTINFPKQLIFIGRNMNLVRSLNKFYGGVGDRIPVMAQTAYVGTTIQSSLNARRSFNFYFQSFRFYMKVWLMQIIDWWLHNVMGKSIEKIVQDETVKNTQKMFESYGFKPLNQTTYAS